MKILNVNAQNVRSYKKLSIPLSPYLNIFRGRTDSGKSGFVKTLLFVIKNLITKNTITKRSTGESFVTISDDKTIITRLKHGKNNNYSVKVKGEKLKEYDAVAKQIPFHVKEALNLSDANIQEQKESYFLIDKSNGFISKKLNEVSGLSEIDRTLKAITTEINILSSNVKEKEKRVKEDTLKIKETEWALSADISFKEIEKLDSEIEKLECETLYLNDSIQEYFGINYKINALLPESLIIEYNKLKDMEEDENLLSTNIDKINYIILQFEKIQKSYDECDIIDLTDLESITKEIDDISSTIEYISNTIDSYISIKQKLVIAEEKLTKTEKLISKVKLCPTCKRPMVSNIKICVEH